MEELIALAEKIGFDIEINNDNEVTLAYGQLVAFVGTPQHAWGICKVKEARKSTTCLMPC